MAAPPSAFSTTARPETGLLPASVTRTSTTSASWPSAFALSVVTASESTFALAASAIKLTVLSAFTAAVSPARALTVMSATAAVVLVKVTVVWPPASVTPAAVAVTPGLSAFGVTVAPDTRLP
ncbi:hypothetical protein ACSFCW_27295, partial [Yokenella regensburgei]|uniref:hypothetical protein n=1 Tax=Yokenella regensburgei TaxID=158877 RepID=UPI003ED84F8C